MCVLCIPAEIRKSRWKWSLVCKHTSVCKRLWVLLPKKGCHQTDLISFGVFEKRKKKVRNRLHPLDSLSHVFVVPILTSALILILTNLRCKKVVSCLPIQYKCKCGVKEKREGRCLAFSALFICLILLLFVYCNCADSRCALGPHLKSVERVKSLFNYLCLSVHVN